MAKVRVYELAKDLGLESKDLITRIAEIGINVKNHMSTLEADEVTKINGLMKGGNTPKQKPPEIKQPEGPQEVRPPAQGAQQQGPGHVQGGPPADRQRPPAQRPQGREGGAQFGPGILPGKKPQRIWVYEPGKEEQQKKPGAYGQRPPQQRPQGPGQRPPQGAGQPRPQGDGQQRPQGQDQRPPQGAGQQRYQGGGQQRPQGQYPPRPQGQYPPRPQGGQGQGQPRPQGGQPFRPQQGGGQQRPAQAGQRPQPNRRGPAIPPPPAELEKAPERRDFSDRAKKDKRFERLDNRKDVNQRNAQHKGKGKGRPPEKRTETIGTIAPKELKPIVMGDSISVQDLAEKMSKKASELIKKLMLMGVMATINQEIDADTATLLAADFGREVEVMVDEELTDFITEVEDNPADLMPRPCVVTVMGHVDHGKTSLLDAVRETNVIAGEAGGITQHIGAYQVEHNDKKITFLDTPGHEAFTAMRARGAQVTDIAILVVAADDGVMPQTIEAINHAKAAGVPVIVAINKMDKPGANPERVKQELTEHGLVSEDWGGETICVPVSAKSKEGIDHLLEMVLLVAEIGELKANPKRLAKGTVVEAELDKGRGPVATVLVQNGTLQIGDAIVAGTAFGKVRAMLDDKGRRVKKAGPSTPVEVLGLSDVPQAGDVFHAIEDEKKARSIATKRMNKRREEEFKSTAKVSLEDLFKQIQEGQVKDLNIIIKADVQGSIEALKQSLAKLTTSEVRVNPIHGGVGGITETDIMLASASNAIIIGFNVRPDTNARRAAENEKVDLRLYRVIYNAIEDVKAAMTGLLDPEFKEVVIGRVEVRQTFKVSKVGTIAGCYVTEGKITKNSEVRVIREGIVIHEGKLDSLKRFKDDAKEVLESFECGIMIDKFNDIEEGDIIEAFVMEEVKREL